MSFTKLEECTLVFRPHPSAVVTYSLLPVLAAMLPSDNRMLTLLGTCIGAHSFTNKLFRNLVQGRGRMRVLVRNTAGFVLGAFVEDAFVDSGTYTHGRDTNFILTLGATTGVPVKLLMTDPSDEYGVCMCSQWDVDSICVSMPGSRSASPQATSLSSQDKSRLSSMKPYSLVPSSGAQTSSRFISTRRLARFC